MELNKLQMLIKKSEGAKLDFKRDMELLTSSQKKEFAKDVAAIANTPGGRGYIIFGIEDKNKNVVGVEYDKYMEEKIQQIIAQRIDPPVAVRMEYVKYRRKSIGVLTIFKSIQKPHQIRQNGAFYIRRGSTTDVARRIEVASMFQRSGILSIEMTPIYEATADDIDERLVYEYCRKINLDEAVSHELYEMLGICVSTGGGHMHPTLGGLMVFGRHPQKYIVGSSVRVVSNIESKIVRVFHGNILGMLDESEKYIDELIGGLGYPVAAVFEALRNSLVHRDYFDINRETVVYIDGDRVEVSNPGTILNGDSLKEIAKESNPPRRNSWIYERLIILDEQKRFLESGMGLKRMEKCFDEPCRVKFLNIFRRNMFKVVFPGISNRLKC